MKQITELTIAGPYEVELIRKIVAQADRSAGRVNAANMRSLNYATRRLNDRATHAGLASTDLHYPGEL
jgi:hypothetical protein